MTLIRESKTRVMSSVTSDSEPTCRDDHCHPISLVMLRSSGINCCPNNDDDEVQIDLNLVTKTTKECRFDKFLNTEDE